MRLLDRARALRRGAHLSSCALGLLDWSCALFFILLRCRGDCRGLAAHVIDQLLLELIQV